MAHRYRNHLPQLGDELFMTDGGIETTLIFHKDFDLPEFAAFHLLDTPEGNAGLESYFSTYADLARNTGSGIIFESATWRASPDWLDRLGYSAEAIDHVNRRSIHLLERLRRDIEAKGVTAVISGCVGPRGDGYVVGAAMSAKEAERYHQAQIDVFESTAADMVTAVTMTYVDEAIGVTVAARNARMPVAISFTVETDGRLPTGQSLSSAIEEVDRATAGYPSYFMINCAHPTHFSDVLLTGGAWTKRVRGIRANASPKSHAELDAAPALDEGNPRGLGMMYALLKHRMPQLTVVGGCCGTDHRHVGEIVRACRPFARTTVS